HSLSQSLFSLLCGRSSLHIWPSLSLLIYLSPFLSLDLSLFLVLPRNLLFNSPFFSFPPELAFIQHSFVSICKVVFPFLTSSHYLLPFLGSPCQSQLLARHWICA